MLKKDTSNSTARILGHRLAIVEHLLSDEVTEIVINQPGEVWVEATGAQGMQRHELPQVSSDWLRWLSIEVAGYSDQHIDQSHPIIGASLPDGERIQIIAPPAVDSMQFGVSIRRQSVKDTTINELDELGMFESMRVSDINSDQSHMRDELKGLIERGDHAAFFSEIIKRKCNIVGVGGTSTGKTTFLNALGKFIPEYERIITIEDARETTLPHKNQLNMLFSRNERGTSNVTATELLEASLRLRPDRVLVSELRGNEAGDWLQAVNTGHPGSMTTVHASSISGTIQRLVLMLLSSPLGRNMPPDIAREYVLNTVDVIIQIVRDSRGKRSIQDVWIR